MSKAMILREEVEDNPDLRTYEEAVYQAEQEVRESFYHIGMALAKIKDDEPFKPDVGKKPNGKTTFKNWSAYCASGRCRYKIAGADRAIRAALQRQLLPTLKNSYDSYEIFWTRETAEQMARLDSKSDINAAVSKIRAALKQGEKFTTALVKSIVDDVLGVTHAKKKKAKKVVDATPAAGAVLDDLSDTADTWLESLKKFTPTMWKEAEAGSPGSVKRLTQALLALVSFLKE